jgi:hypothetical protein
MVQTLFHLIIWIALLATNLQHFSLQASPMANPYAPTSGDASWQRGTVMIERVEATHAPGQSEQRLTIHGSLPTPCHQLRVSIPEKISADGVLRIQAWSVNDPNALCAQVLQPFSAQMSLGSQHPAQIAVNNVMASGL